MKIAIASTTSDLSGNVENKMGSAAYLLVIETDDMSFQANKGPEQPNTPGAGIQALSIILEKEPQVVIVGFISPHISNVLIKEGIEVVTQVSGSVTTILNLYLASQSPESVTTSDELPIVQPSGQEQWRNALGKGVSQFQSFLPRFVGVILLLGLFHGFVSRQMLLSMFSGSPLFDSFRGAFLGSILAGNPINSYVIGKSLLSIGVGLTGSVAMMLAWVNVGVIQLPAESEAMGFRFALVRNLTGFTMAIAMSFALTILIGDTLK